MSHVAYEARDGRGFVIVAGAPAARERELEDATEELAHLAGLTGSINASGRSRTFPLPAAPPARPFVGSVVGELAAVIAVATPRH